MSQDAQTNGSCVGFNLKFPTLRWLAIVLPVVYLTVIELVRVLLFPQFFQSGAGYVITAGLIVLGSALFANSVFGLVGRMQRRLMQQNQELLALHKAGLAVTGALDLQLVLQNVVNEARELVGARYGALALLDEQSEVGAFLTSGISEQLRNSLGPIPKGRGLLGVVLEEAKPVRLVDLGQDPRSVGFPPGHPSMCSLLAVPIVSHGKVLGGLYLTERQHRSAFDQSDQRRLERFATQAALAIENAHLHQQVKVLAIAEERDRIAREMHDSIAQVLGYVNTKGQAAQELLRSGESIRAEQQIGQLTQAARAAYADVRENILGLRAQLSDSSSFLETLRGYLSNWQDQSGIVTRLDALAADERQLGLAPLAELQLLRVVQEALSNVRKHSNADRAIVTLRGDCDALQVTIADNGTGFDPSSIGSTGLPRFGLSTMRERAESVGGQLKIDSRPGQGTQVDVRIPVHAGTADMDEVEYAHPHR